MFVEHWVESSRSYLLWFSRWVCCATVKSSKCFQCSMQFCQLCVPLTLKRTKKNQKNINANNAQLTNPSWFGNAKKNLLGTYWGPFLTLRPSRGQNRSRRPKIQNVFLCCLSCLSQEGISLATFGHFQSSQSFTHRPLSLLHRGTSPSIPINTTTFA